MSRITVTVENRFYKDQSGKIWTDNHFPYDFWTRYLKVFDKVRVVARVQPVNETEEKWKEVEGKNVEMFELPYYIGPLGYLKNFFKIRARLNSLIESDDCFLLRVPSPIADILQPLLVKSSKSYAVEVVGDPWDVFGPGVFHHPLRPILRYYFTYKLKRQCANAYCASYVTQSILQNRYPVKSGRFTIGASSIVLKDSDIVDRPKEYTEIKTVNIINVGSLEYHVKGTDTLIKAVSHLKNKDIQFNLKVLGDGRFRPDYEKMITDLGLSERVKLLGNVPAGEKVKQLLDQSDVFILPSRSEGLPRAMIEAMARGLFCLGTKAGGINELLDEDFKVEIDDHKELAKKIYKFSSNPKTMNIEASKNLEKAKDYHHEILDERRQKLYTHLKESK